MLKKKTMCCRAHNGTLAIVAHSLRATADWTLLKVTGARAVAGRRTSTQALTHCVTPNPTGAPLPLDAQASPPGLEGSLPGLKAILPPSVAGLLTRRRENMARITLRPDSTHLAPEFGSLITLTENSKSPPATSTSLRICSAPKSGQVQKSVTNLAAAVRKLCDTDR